MPAPSARQSNVSAITPRGTASDSPTSRTSPAAGWAPKHPNASDTRICSVRSTASVSGPAVATAASEHGGISRSAKVSNATASSVSVRCEATSAPAATRTVSCRGADSQNVTSVLAAVGGTSAIPSSSRNRT